MAHPETDWDHSTAKDDPQAVEPTVPEALAREFDERAARHNENIAEIEAQIARLDRDLTQQISARDALTSALETLKSRNERNRAVLMPDTSESRF